MGLKYWTLRLSLLWPPTGTDLPEDEDMKKMLQTQLGKTEISMTLSNKFEVPEDDQADVKQLLVRSVGLAVCTLGFFNSSLLTSHL